MKINDVFIKVITRIHRILLHFKPYEKLAFRFGLDSYNRKKYYERLHFDNPAEVDDSEVDGYHGEGDFQKIEKLVDNLFRLVPNPEAILDIGCGTGRYLKQMAKVSPQSHLEGVDISREIIEKFTRKQVPDIPVHVLDVETDETFYLDCRGKFDLICMIGIIQILSVTKIKNILKKIHIMSKENGYLYLQFNLETKEKKTLVGYKRYSIEELDKILTGSGFKILHSAKTDILEDYAYIVAQKY